MIKDKLDLDINITNQVSERSSRYEVILALMVFAISHGQTIKPGGGRPCPTRWITTIRTLSSLPSTFARKIHYRHAIVNRSFLSALYNTILATTRTELNVLCI